MKVRKEQYLETVNNVVEIYAVLAEAMEVIDDYLNAGNKDQRKNVSKQAKMLYRAYYGKDYVNRNERI